MARVLVIDDLETTGVLLTMVLGRALHEVLWVTSLAQGLSAAQEEQFEVLFLDVRLPDGNGIEWVRRFRSVGSRPEVIIYTAFPRAQDIEIAFRNGASEYLSKDAQPAQITRAVKRALEIRRERAARQTMHGLLLDGIVGNSPPMQRVLEQVALAAQSKANTLVVGETGTGKELVARAIHVNSPRAAQRLVTVDCASLPETLVESLLFGHEKGTFTGADRSREGLIQQAQGGTLFLDEVGELSLSIQKAFLRALQEHRVRPLGARKEIEIDFRLIAATNRRLDELVVNGQFREDLLFRLQAMQIEMPPLRARREDMEVLIAFHIRRLCGIYGIAEKRVSPCFLETLARHDWPGNVRELVNFLEQAFARAGSRDVLWDHDLPLQVRVRARQSLLETVATGKKNTASVPFCLPMDSGEFPRMKDHRTFVERQYLDALMRFSRGNRKEACRLSGLSRTRLFELLKEHDMLDYGYQEKSPSGISLSPPFLVTSLGNGQSGHAARFATKRR